MSRFQLVRTYLFFLFMAPIPPARAATSYQINYHAEATITEFGVCRVVANHSPTGLALFVPTATDPEWTTFQNNPPAGVTVAWGPPCIAGVSFWIDGRDTGNMFTNSTCTTNVSATGQSVLCWKSRIGGLSFTQATAGSAPIYNSTGGPTAYPSVMFATKSLTSGSANLNPRTIYFVYSDTSTASWVTPFTSAATVVTDGAFHGNTDDTSVFNATYTNAALRAGTNYTNGYSWVFTSTPGTLDDRPDSWSILNYNATSNYANAAGAWYLGIDRGLAGRELQGGIAEIILYNVALSASDREKVEGYLACRWGLQSTLPAGHTYKSSCVFN